MPTALHLRIGGRVQGVGFRYSLHLEARRLGVSGWVRNRHDGTVEAVVQGSAEAVEALVNWSRQGPSGARVTNVEVQPAEGDYTGFELRPTA
jgi:acylphosphatase